jgi:hypothetical protein
MYYAFLGQLALLYGFMDRELGEATGSPRCGYAWQPPYL